MHSDVTLARGVVSEALRGLCALRTTTTATTTAAGAGAGVDVGAGVVPRAWQKMGVVTTPLNHNDDKRQPSIIAPTV